ncbi:MAG: 3-methyl-2-oxobutanoate dehydrogenase subunit VorB [Christensenellaceae bacterium]|jgi:pyruvate flavodoxin/ferredoxin oxidoreductase domain protein|nr:3-methyl-2-oxobutanoate dehydrogenase subunit VorB [Christensenellaceae bacterium]MBS6564993.1 3-methyl-2-oxobutanoate dehydrogenase subunit VorB [Clostridiales bacterium]PWL99489.1 MAG: 3-methyl-2-oxobutanoate dehydrogenase subunit beta [Selenomonadales bacterium]
MKHLMKGNEAIAEAAIKAGCRFFFGYPITPQNQIPEYMSKRMPEIGGCFLQAESEVAAINMVYGASGAGARVMTSSSSPGISLKQEGISYMACAELPAVIVNMVRGGPGLGSIQPAQSDYFQMTKGGGHGDYKLIVFAPDSVQEAVDLTYSAFDTADKYRTPVVILGDGMIGQMMEPVEMPEEIAELPEKPWATTGCAKGERRIINSLYIEPDVMEKVNLRLQEKYNTIARNETRWEEYFMEDAEMVITAYGTTARIAKKSIKELRKAGVKAGLIRPITLWPFPAEAINKAAARAKAFLTVEMSCGQMVEDVRLAVNGQAPVEFFGRAGGMIPSWKEIYAAAEKALGGVK